MITSAKSLGFALAILMATSSGALAAVSKTENFVNTFMPPGITVRTGTPDQVLAASEQAVRAAHPRRVTTASIVALGAKWAPRLVTELAEVALENLASTTGSSQYLPTATSSDTALRRGQRVSYTKSVMKTTINTVLKGNTLFVGGVLNKADGAAAVTSRAVCAVKDSPFPNLLGTVVSEAIKRAKNSGPRLGGSPSNQPSPNGAAGAVTGALVSVSGSSNNNITDNQNTLGSDDFVTLAVVKAAAKAGASRLRDVAQAVGYAFAGTYRATTADMSEDSEIVFKATNAQTLIDTMYASLPRPLRKNANKTLITDFLNEGITMAYADTNGPGFNGVNQFAYNNCNGTPVTDVSGL